MTYANQYRTTGGRGVPCFSCSFPDAPIRESYQPRWDGWGRFMEPLASRVTMMVTEGNHEIEPQGHGGAATFASYLARFAVPSEESGSNTKFYYSFNAGGIHFIMLGAYVDYNRTGAQYSWLEKDLHKVDRRVTPWVVASWHTPWYNSYSSHYQEFECMRQEMEGLLYQHGVDIVFSGHVHAYERMNRVFNYTLDPCGPVYITIGDGGNIEKIDIDHADDPGKCPSPGDNHPEFGGVCHLNFTSGPAKGKFCWERQPEWSAFRESSFGHGILEVIKSLHTLLPITINSSLDVCNTEGNVSCVCCCTSPHMRDHAGCEFDICLVDMAPEPGCIQRTQCGRSDLYSTGTRQVPIAAKGSDSARLDSPSAGCPSSTLSSTSGAEQAAKNGRLLWTTTSMILSSTVL
ncbi:unnamed protein product [Triticum turgidum subsp. durum]|uniref:Calcineurin-like phosphoesterase domain-containing protein n=1 Tax=Triticum turgidum subsp. durum TaxID=4567 RepID=A0A9R0TQ21_TRITD|nr:unnamed protein product [Triticum turgidum subsp. durum]